MAGNPLLESWSAGFAHTQPRQYKDSAEAYYAEQEAALAFGVDQAVSRGLIDPQAAEEAKTAQNRTWWDNLLGFEKGSNELLGATAQGIVDVLSLGNYASAAATAATIKDPLIQIGQFKLGFSPSTWLREFQKRPYYGDMVDSFWGGLALDIAMDPTTYLTFGVGSGAKIGAQGITRVGARELAENVGKLTLTRHGEQIYKVAAMELRPLYDQILKAQNEELIKAGKEPLKHLNLLAADRLHNQIGRHMIDNYPALQKKVVDNMTRWDRVKSQLDTTVKSSADKLAEMFNAKPSAASYTAEDMFRETARVQQRDLGVDFAAAGKWLTNHPMIGQAARSVMPAFKRDYGVPEDIVHVWHETSGTIKQKGSQAAREIEERLGKYSPEDLDLMTSIIEADDFAESGVDAAGRMMYALKNGQKFDQEVLDGANWAKERFAQIAERENAAGFNVETLKSYVQRVYKTHGARNLILSHVRAAAIPNMTQKGSFQLHRVIATIEDAANQLGKDIVEKNIGNILLRREMASIKMVEMEKFYDYIKSTAGITPMLVYQANNEGVFVANTLKKILKQNRPPKDVIFDFDQVYAAPDAIHRKLGFVDEVTGPEAGKRAADLLEYLKQDPVERINNAEKYASLSPTETAKTFRKVDLKFRVGDLEYDAALLLKEHYTPGSPWNLLSHIQMASKKVEGATARDVQHFVREMDNMFRKKLGIPLIHMFPDFVESMKRATMESSKFTTKSGARLTKKSQQFFSDLDKLLRLNIRGDKNFVAQMPEEIINRAKYIRMRGGDMTDFTSRSAHQISEIFRLSKKLGMAGENVKEVMSALIGHKSFSENLTAREADKLIAFLGSHAKEWTKGEGSYKTVLFDDEARFITFGQRSKPIFDKPNEEYLRSVRDAEAYSAAESSRKLRLESYKTRIRNAEKYKKTIEDQVAEMEKLLTPDLPVGRAKELKAKIAQMKGDIDSTNRVIAELDGEMLKVAEPIPPKDPIADTRNFVPSDEFLRKNADQLTKVDEDFFGRRKGFKKTVHNNILEILPKEIKDGVRAAIKEIRSSHKDIYKEIEAARNAIKSQEDVVSKLQTKIDEYDVKLAEFSKKGIEKSYNLFSKKRSEAYDLISQERTKLKEMERGLRDTVDNARNKAQAALKKTSEFRIVDGGQYIGPDGKVRDIILRKNKHGRYFIGGRYSREIAKALAEDIIINGRKSMPVWEHALGKDIPANVIGTNAGTYLVPTSVANFIEDIVTPQYAGENYLLDRLLMGYDWVQNAFKAPLLAPWFSTMARNAIGNVSLAYLKTGVAALSKDNLTDFMKMYHYILAKESPNYKKLFSYFRKDMDDWIQQVGEMKIKSHSGEELITIKELSEEFGRRGVTSAWMNDEIFQFGSIGPMGERIAGSVSGAILGGSIGGPWGAVAGAALPPAAGLLKKRDDLVGMAAKAIADREAYKMRNMFRFHELAGEIPVRLMLALHEFKGGATIEASTAEVRKYLNDYGELSVFERRVLRRVFPFYNFMKHAISISGKSVIENPGRLLMPYKIFHEQNITGAGGDTAALPEDVPDWFNQQLKFMGKDFDEETGQWKSWVINGFNLPLQEVLQLTDIVGPGGQDITQIGGRTAFGATTALEYLTNYDSFRGVPIYPNIEAGIKQTVYESGNQFKGSPDWLKTLVGFQVGEDGQARVNPKVAWALGKIPTSRFVNVAKKVYDAEDPESLNYTDLSKSILGTSIYRYDAQTMRYFENKARVNAMATLLSSIQHLKSYDIDRSTFLVPKKKTKSNNPLLGG